MVFAGDEVLYYSVYIHKLFFVDGYGNGTVDPYVFQDISLTPQSLPEDISAPAFEYTGTGTITYQWGYYDWVTDQYKDITGANSMNFSRNYLVPGKENEYGDVLPTFYYCTITDGQEGLRYQLNFEGSSLGAEYGRIPGNTRRK